MQATKRPLRLLRLIQALRRRRAARLADPNDQLQIDRQLLAERQAAARDKLGSASLIHPSNALRRLSRPYPGPTGGAFNAWPEITEMVHVTDAGIRVGFGPDNVARPNLLRKKMKERELLEALTPEGIKWYRAIKADLEKRG